MGPERTALELRALPEMVPLELREEFQDAVPGPKRRARLSSPVYAIAPVLHRPAKDERAVAPHHLFGSGPLAELVRDGPLLHGPPRLVPQVSRRRGPSVEHGAVLAKRGLRPGNRQQDCARRPGSGEGSY